MINNYVFEDVRGDVYCSWVRKVLNDHSSYYLTKEEIYCNLPTDERNMPYMTLNGLDRTLRKLVRTHQIKARWVGARRYYSIN